MDQQDASTTPGTPRRDVLLAAGAALIAAHLPAAAAETAIDDAGFLALSRAATGHDGLSPVTARRLFVAMTQSDPGFAAQAGSLIHFLHDGMDPEELLALADRAGLKPAMLAIVAAWYTGSTGANHDGKVVAYHDSLMYASIADAVPVPTYCGNGPLWWTGDPPGIALPPAPNPGAKPGATP